MKKGIMLAIFVLISAVLAGSVLAEGLVIDDIDAYVDGSHKSMSTTGGTTVKIKPESELKIKVKVKNTFSSSADQELQDIVVTGTIEEIDDGDDMEEESDSFDIKESKSKTVTLEYDIPLQVDDGDYNLKILVEGENSTNHKFNASEEYTIRVDKENNLLIFSKAELDKTRVACGRSTQLSAIIYNLGQDDESDVSLTVRSEELGIDVQKTFDLSSDISDDDNRYSETFDLRVPQNTKAGVYPVDLRAVYKDGAKSAEKSVDLTVECEAAAVNRTVVTKPAVTPPVEPAQTVIPAVTATPVSSSNATLYTGLTIAAYVVVAIIIIAVAVVLLRKKKEE